MATTVSARMSEAVKREAQRRLDALGASHSDLIHAAYAYLLATGSLPTPAVQGARDVSDARRRELARLCDATRIRLDGTRAQASHASSTHELAVRAKRRRYAALARG